MQVVYTITPPEIGNNIAEWIKKLCVYTYKNNGTLIGLTNRNIETRGKWSIFPKALMRQKYLARSGETIDQISISLVHSNPFAPGGYCIEVNSTSASKFRILVGQEGFTDTIVDLHGQRHLESSQLTVVDIFNLLSEINQMIESQQVGA